MKKFFLFVPVALLLTVVLLFVGLASGMLGPQAPSSAAIGDIPANYLSLYQRAADTCPGLDWTILAAIGKVETNHGRLTAPGVSAGVNFAGAAGPMQFGVGGKAGNTWAAYGIDGDQPPDGHADVYNPADAIFTAARYLCANGGGRNVQQAVFAYNRATWYVQKVMAQASRYAATPALTGGSTDVKALLANPRLTLTANARADLEAGVIDARVVAVMNLLLESHTASVSVFKGGHSLYVRGTTHVSNHIGGRAVDIFAIDGQPVTIANQQARSVVAWLANGQGQLRPDEVGSPFAEFDPIPGWFSNYDHRNHIHIGWDS
jgi:hypothetical protein